jgi:hypothetical protein
MRSAQSKPCPLTVSDYLQRPLRLLVAAAERPK